MVATQDARVLALAGGFRSSWRPVPAPSPHRQRNTIASQVQTLRARITRRGTRSQRSSWTTASPGRDYQTTPGLDALRDGAEAGAFEVVWCRTPDRLARS